MASKKGNTIQLDLSKKLSPIYTLLDSHNYKAALKQITGLIEKYGNIPLVLV